tara:strand:- start:34269 stop:35276 length:1008 start_codon:yes stop_codon:yes gene_type:complete
MGHGFKDMGKNSTFATRKELAWHGLGSVVDSMNSKEAMILGGLDFEVGLAPLRVEFPNLVQVRRLMENQVVLSDMPVVDGNFATYRKDNNHVFGIVGSRYEVIQNTEAFGFFDSIIGEGHASYETVGALGDGERVFLTAKLPNKLIVNKEDIDKYLLLSMAHDGSGAINVLFTPVRVVCNNTLTFALGKATNKVSIRHTKNALTRLDNAKKILGIAERNFTTLGEYFERISKRKMTDESAEYVFRKAFNIIEDSKGELSTRSKNKLEAVTKYYHEGVGQEGIVGNAWGVLNGVTGYLQNGEDREDQKQFNRTFVKGDEEIRTRAKDAISVVNDWM